MVVLATQKLKSKKTKGWPGDDSITFQRNQRHLP